MRPCARDLCCQGGLYAVEGMSLEEVPMEGIPTTGKARVSENIRCAEKETEREIEREGEGEDSGNWTSYFSHFFLYFYGDGYIFMIE